MVDINRMKNPIIPKVVEEIDLLDLELQECPYAAYKLLRDEAPVYRDPGTGYYVVSRYEDLRRISLDTEGFCNGQRKVINTIDPGRAERIKKLYQDKGWLPAPSLNRRDNPEHRQMRAVFDKAFRAGKIRDLDPAIEELANRLFDSFINDGRCDWVRQFAVPLPLTVIAVQMGAPEEDIWRIKAWTDAWVKKLGLMQSEEEAIWSTEQEIEAQHYFQPLFERLRKQPNDTLLSDLVNQVIPEWGRPLNDNELHATMMSDTFVGGSETTTNAFSGGIMLLAEDKDSWSLLKSEPDKFLKTFVEEVLRLESPVQGLTRVATRDIEMHGVLIPAGSVINTRYGAANRDDRKFEDPDKLNLHRDNAGSHLAFGTGSHHCLGAPLARRELYLGFKAFIERIDDFWLEDDNDMRHVPNYFLRSLKRLNIGFTKKQ